MKKLFLATVVFITTVVSSANAQNVKDVSVPHDLRFLLTTSGYSENINAKAVRNFAKQFKQAPDAEWYKVDNGYTALFKSGDVRHRIFYNKKGNWLYTIKYYSETSLPKTVRAQVKSTYFDYAIVGITEVELVNEPTIYLVHMADADTYKIVSVCNEEMSIVDDFKKAL